MLQVEVSSWENEIPATVRTLGPLHLRGKTVAGDALLAQRELSAQIVEGGGEHVQPVKCNPEGLKEDIEVLFAAESCVPGFGKAFRRGQIHAIRGIDEPDKAPPTKEVTQ